MTGFSAASQSSLCATISHRVLSAAVELDEVAEGTELSGLPDQLREYSKIAESLGKSITRATSVSGTLQHILSGFLDSCAQAAAVLEKEVKTFGAGKANSATTDPTTVSKFEHWTAIATQASELLKASIKVPLKDRRRSDLIEQDAVLRSSGTRQVLQECNRASRSVIELSTQLAEDADHPPGYGDSISDYPNDVKDPSLFEIEPHTSSALQSAAGPSQPKQARGGLTSLSDTFKAMTAPFRYKPEPLVVALCEASARGNINNISSLISSGANVNGRDESGKTPIVRAIETKQLEVVQELLNQGASRAVADTAKKLPPLFWAAEGGDLAIATLLLRRGCDPREKTMFGSSYFTGTVLKGNVDMVRLLLDNGADIHATDSVGRSVVFHAFSKGSLEMMKLLQSRGANMNARDISGSPLVILAMQDGRIDMLQFLLNHGADANSTSITGSALLMEALHKGRLDVIKLLLDKGANPNVSDISGNPIVIVVIKSAKFNSREKVELIRLLLSRGASPNISDSWGWTAMSYVIDKGHTELIPLFIEGGADPNQEIANGPTLLIHCIEQRQAELVAELLRRGANPNAVDKKGRTPLMLALRMRDMATARRLVQHGADPNKEAMVSPLAFARALGDSDIASFLRTHGATPEADDNIMAVSSAVPSILPPAQPSGSAQNASSTEGAPPDYDTVLKQ